VSIHKYTVSCHTGSEAEKKFLSLMAELDIGISPSSHLDNMRKHYDFITENNVKIEVKARKRISRQDAVYNDDLIYIEFTNIQGRNGWLYGEADYIAFERKAGFLFIDRKELVTLAETLIKDDFSEKPEVYKRYRRKKQPKESVGLLNYTDLLTLNYMYFKCGKL
jgi:hypothetical protein